MRAPAAAQPCDFPHPRTWKPVWTFRSRAS